MAFWMVRNRKLNVCSWALPAGPLLTSTLPIANVEMWWLADLAMTIKN